MFGKKHKQWSAAPAMQLDPAKKYTASLETNKGTIEVELLASEAPKTVNNFVFLAGEGFYDGVPFHRVIKGFMVQTGDPTGTGTGGPGYRFADEPVSSDYTPGTLAMANSGPNTNGSQFFIMHGNHTGRLPKNYNIFGKVVEGMNVVDKIASAPTTMGNGGEPSQPVHPVVIRKITITRIGGS